MSAKYCAHCGAPLYSDAAFCSQCGRPVRSPPAAPQPPPQRTGQPAPQPAAYAAEPILDVIPALQRRKGMLGMRVETLNLILTPTRMVFVPVSSQEMREAVRTAHNEAKSQGQGWLGQVAAQMAWVDVICNRYRSMGVDRVLAQYPDSFYMLNTQVRRIDLQEELADEDEPGSLEMTVEGAGDKFDFEVPRVSSRDLQKRLKQVLPHAIR